MCRSCRAPARDAHTPRIRELSRALFDMPGARGRFIQDEESLGGELRALLPPDFVSTPKAPELAFIHRTLKSGELYFVVNTSNRVVRAQLAFRRAARHVAGDAAARVRARVGNPRANGRESAWCAADLWMAAPPFTGVRKA